jgi:hypothetical protein
LADEEGISVNQLISSAIAEKLSAIDTEKYLADRASRGSVAKFRKVMRKIPAAKVDAGDDLPRT